MAFVRFKGIKDKAGNLHYYLYKAENHWDKFKKQSRQKVVGYVGKVEGVEGVSQSQLAAIFNRDGWQCQLCNRERGLTIDHKISLLDGGTNNPENLWVLCNWCNLSKGRIAIMTVPEHSGNFRHLEKVRN